MGGLHCLSAFTASVPAGYDNVKAVAESSGLHCLSAFTASVPGRGVVKRHPRQSQSPLPFGVHRFGPKTSGATIKFRYRKVSIAFRRSPLRSPQGVGPGGEAWSGLHCLSAFTASVPPKGQVTVEAVGFSLHCLSAFTASVPDSRTSAVSRSNPPSPLPFGVHRFGPITLSDACAAWTSHVSIAFRRSPLRSQSATPRPAGGRRRSPLPFGVHRFGPTPGLPASPGATVVSIAFRRSPLRSQGKKQ